MKRLLLIIFIGLSRIKQLFIIKQNSISSMIYQRLVSPARKQDKKPPDTIPQNNSPDLKQQQTTQPTMKISEWIDHNIKNEGFNSAKKPNIQRKVQKKTRELKFYTSQQAIVKAQEQVAFKLPDTSHKLKHPNQKKELPGQYLQQEILWDKKTVYQIKQSRFLQSHPQVIQEQKRKKQELRLQKIKAQEERVQRMKQQLEGKRQIYQQQTTRKGQQLKQGLQKINEFVWGSKKKNSRLDQYKAAKTQRSNGESIENIEKNQIQKQSSKSNHEKSNHEQQRTKIDHSQQIKKIQSTLWKSKQQKTYNYQAYIKKPAPQNKQSTSVVVTSQREQRKPVQKTDIEKIENTLWRQKHRSRINAEQYAKKNNQQISENGRLSPITSPKKRFVRQQNEQPRKKVIPNPYTLQGNKSKPAQNMQEFSNSHLKQDQPQQLNIYPNSDVVNQKLVLAHKKKTQSVRSYEDIRSLNSNNSQILVKEAVKIQQSDNLKPAQKPKLPNQQILWGKKYLSSPKQKNIDEYRRKSIEKNAQSKNQAILIDSKTPSSNQQKIQKVEAFKEEFKNGKLKPELGQQDLNKTDKVTLETKNLPQNKQSSVYVHQNQQPQLKNAHDNPYISAKNEVQYKKQLIKEQISHKGIKLQVKQQSTSYIKKFDSVNEKQQIQLKGTNKESKTIVKQEVKSGEVDKKQAKKSQVQLIQRKVLPQTVAQPQSRVFSKNTVPQSTILHQNAVLPQNNRQRSLMIAFALKKLFNAKISQSFMLIKQSNSTLKRKTSIFSKIFIISLSSAANAIIKKNLSQSLIKIKRWTANSMSKDGKQMEVNKKRIFQSQKCTLANILAILAKKKLSNCFLSFQKLKKCEQLKLKAISSLSLLFTRKIRQNLHLIKQRATKSYQDRFQQVFKKVDKIMCRLTIRTLKLSFNKLLTANLEPLPKSSALKKKLSNVSSGQSSLASKSNYSSLVKKDSIQSNNNSDAIRESQRSAQLNQPIQNNIKVIQMKMEQKRQVFQNSKKQLDQQLLQIRSKYQNRQQEIKQYNQTKERLKTIAKGLKQKLSLKHEVYEDAKQTKQKLDQLATIYCQINNSSQQWIEVKDLLEKYGLKKEINKADDFIKQMTLFEQNSLLRMKMCNIQGCKNEQKQKIQLMKQHQGIRQLLRGYVNQSYAWNQLKKQLNFIY